MKKFFFVFMVFFLFSDIHCANQKSYEELYKEFFGSEFKDELIDSSFSLVFDYSPKGYISVKRSLATEKVFVNSKALLSIVSPSLEDDLLNSLKLLIKDNEYIDTKSLIDLGFLVEIQKKKIILNTKLGQKKILDIELTMPRVEKIIPPDIFPSDYSGYINFGFNQPYIHEGGFLFKKPLLSWQSNSWMKGLVLQTKGKFNEFDKEKLSLDGVVFIKDFPEKQTRFLTGQVFSNLYGYQDLGNLWGIQYSRFFFKPFIPPIDSTYRYSLRLDKLSYVDVYLNQYKISSFLLSQGNYNFKSFPLIYGKNFVKFNISSKENPSDNYQILQTVYKKPDRISQQITNFSYTFGVPVNSQDDSFDYNKTKLLGFYSKYINADWDSTYYGQISSLRELLGMDFVLYQQKGNSKFGINQTLSQSGDLGVSLESQYYFPISSEGFLDTQSLALVYRTKGFGITDLYVLPYDNLSFNYFSSFKFSTYNGVQSRFSLSSENQFLNIDLSLAAWYIQNLYNVFNFNLTSTFKPYTSSVVRANLSYGSNSKGSKISFFLNSQFQDSYFSFFSGITFIFDIANTHIFNFGVESDVLQTYATSGYSGLIDDNIKFDTGYKVSLEVPTQNSYYASSSYKKDSMVFSAKTMFSNVKEGSIESTLVNYENQRGFLNFVYLQNQLYNPDKGWVFSSYSNFNFSTAIAYADGHFAISKPINGSFILARPAPISKNSSIFLNVSHAIDDFGNCVIPVSSFYGGDLRVTSIESDLKNFSLYKRKYRYYLPNFSGSSVMVGEGSSLFLQGRLVNAKSEGLSNAIVDIVPISGEGISRQSLLTDYEGYFQIFLNPGRYQLVSKNREDLYMLVPDVDDSMYDLGDIFYD